MPTAIAAELGTTAGDLSRLYGLAVERWGDRGRPQRIIGEYCAVIADPASDRLRLSRSPLRGAAALLFSQPDTWPPRRRSRERFFAAGVEQRLNERRLADSALINFTDLEASWFEGICAGSARYMSSSFSAASRGPPQILRPVRACRTFAWTTTPTMSRGPASFSTKAFAPAWPDFASPGSTLSGGLDTRKSRSAPCRAAGRAASANVHLPSRGWLRRPKPSRHARRRTARSWKPSRPCTRGLEPHFTANEGYGHDHRWNEFFHLMGGAPSGLCNMYVFHGLFAGAAKEGCDVLLLAEWGNYAFSDKGDWGFVEYFINGQWRQLWLALQTPAQDDRSLSWRFLAQCILAPSYLIGLWRMTKRCRSLKGQARRRPDAAASRRLPRLVRGGAPVESIGSRLRRYQPWNRRHASAAAVPELDDAETGEIYQAFEQMYGVPQRDPTAYRPFVEFCFGPADRDVHARRQARWLAKEMAKGIMPEEQRANRLNGRWDADWHLRIGRRRPELLAELDRLAGDEQDGGDARPAAVSGGARGLAGADRNRLRRLCGRANSPSREDF